ncbi:hypothetical protein ACS0TY_002916 [Phlomoides rotata]
MLAYPIRAMGVEKDLLKAGTGPKPIAGQNVTVHCTGFGKNGDLTKKFWSTKDPGQKPFSFQIGKGNVIKGWDEGVLGMQVGEVARLRVMCIPSFLCARLIFLSTSFIDLQSSKCTPDYAYGPSGFPAWGIQPNADLVFEIQVLSVE